MIKLIRKVWFGLLWRIQQSYLGWRRRIAPTQEQWLRVVMNRETTNLIKSLKCDCLDALEISGTQWSNFGFKSYLSTEYPKYDLCAEPYRREAFDVVIAEQVLEHVAWPYKAVKHAWQMLRPGGLLVVTTPFLVRVHHQGQDYSRWTQLGLKNLLIEGGFAGDCINTGSWGNRECAKLNFDDFTPWIPWLDSLRNESEFPVSVWAFARKG